MSGPTPKAKRGVEAVRFVVVIYTFIPQSILAPPFSILPALDGTCGTIRCQGRHLAVCTRCRYVAGPIYRLQEVCRESFAAGILLTDSEVEQNLLTAQNLLDDYSRQSQPSALRELEEELKSTLQVLETDLEDLDESVQIVETSGDRWGLGDDEVKRRRGFIRRVKGQVDGVRAQIRIITGDRKGKGKGNQQGGYSDIPLDVERGEEDDEEQKRWEMEEQQVSQTLVVSCGARLTVDIDAETGRHAGFHFWDIIDFGQSGWTDRERGQRTIRVSLWPYRSSGRLLFPRDANESLRDEAQV